MKSTSTAKLAEASFHDYLVPDCFPCAYRLSPIAYRLIPALRLPPIA
jgi:hypothetical protein